MNAYRYDLEDFVEGIIERDEYEWWRTKKDISEKTEVVMTVDVFVNRRKADEFLRRGEWPQVKAYLQKEIHDDAHRQTWETFKRLPARKVRLQQRKKIVSWSSSTADPAFYSNKESGDSSSMDVEQSSSSASASASASAATSPATSAPSTASSASADGHPCCSSSIPAAGGASTAAETAEAASSSKPRKSQASKGASSDGDCIEHPMITRARKRKLEDPAAAEDDDDDDTRCGICLYPFAKGEKLKTLHCKHEFHSACIHQWLLMGDGQCFCPMCRTCVKCGIPKYRVNIVFFERRGNQFHRLDYLEDMTDD